MAEAVFREVPGKPESLSDTTFWLDPCYPGDAYDGWMPSAGLLDVMRVRATIRDC